MKKAFTLAEVLITLAIIGIVAALTIPNLIINYQKRVIITSLKKSYATINNGIKNYSAMHGCDTLRCTGLYNTWGDSNNENTAKRGQEFYDLITTTFKTVKICNADDNSCVKSGHRSLLNGNDVTENDFMKCSTGNASRNLCKIFITSDNILYKFDPHWTHTYQPVGNNMYGRSIVIIDKIDFYVDINGDNPPNRWGKDVFKFVFTQDEKLLPEGSKALNPEDNWENNKMYCGEKNNKVSKNPIAWEDLENEAMKEDGNIEEMLEAYMSHIVTGEGCTSRIIDEGWEISYF